MLIKGFSKTFSFVKTLNSHDNQVHVHDIYIMNSMLMNAYDDLINVHPQLNLYD